VHAAEADAAKHLEYHHVTMMDRTKSYGTTSQYEHAVLHQLRRMHHSPPVRRCFTSFEKRSHHFMKIIPYEQAQLNAFASAKERVARDEKGAGRTQRRGWARVARQPW